MRQPRLVILVSSPADHRGINRAHEPLDGTWALIAFAYCDTLASA
jgi:hypothetical protein